LDDEGKVMRNRLEDRKRELGIHRLMKPGDTFYYRTGIVESGYLVTKVFKDESRTHLKFTQRTKLRGK
jgi:hypothetical protein